MSCVEISKLFIVQVSQQGMRCRILIKQQIMTSIALNPLDHNNLLMKSINI